MQEEALAIAREMNLPLRVATALNNLALVLWNLGDLDRARTLLGESADIKRSEGNLVGLAISLGNLGAIADATGDLDAATTYLEESLAIDRRLGNLPGIADSLGNLAGIVAPTGDLPRAAALDAEALAIRRDLGDQMSIAFSLEGIASTAARAGRLEAAARLFGAAERLREAIGAPLPPTERERYEHSVAIPRDSLPADTFAQAWAAGRVLSLDEAIAEALHVARQVAKQADDSPGHVTPAAGAQPR